MQLSRKFILVLIVSFLCACSGKNSSMGGLFSEEVGGEGNIPIAEPGREMVDIHFAFDSEKLTDESKSQLRKNSTWMFDNPGKKIIIEGNCDERGTAEYNLALGERRAVSVFNYLRTLGVRGEQMETISYGEELPLDPANNETAWAKNRRVHFAIKE